jgi:hypothetical protein
MQKFLSLIVGFLLLSNLCAQHVIPIFKEGESQIVPEFSKPSEWIKEELWVQTNFDSDSDGKLDRMHVFLTRPLQTNTQGLKLPVIYTTSPYFAGTGGDSKSFYWDFQMVHQPLEVKTKNSRRQQLLIGFVEEHLHIPREQEWTRYRHFGPQEKWV